MWWTVDYPMEELMATIEWDEHSSTSLGPLSCSAWTQDSPLSLTSRVILDKLPHLFKSHFFIYKVTIVIIPISWSYYED